MIMAPKLMANGLRLQGIHRALPANTLDSVIWEALFDGRRIWCIVVQSARAASIRVDFEGFAVASGQVYMGSALLLLGQSTWLQ